jgi:hypothetical protein
MFAQFQIWVAQAVTVSFGIEAITFAGSWAAVRISIRQNVQEQSDCAAISSAYKKRPRFLAHASRKMSSAATFSAKMSDTDVQQVPNLQNDANSVMIGPAQRFQPYLVRIHDQFIMTNGLILHYDLKSRDLRVWLW